MRCHCALLLALLLGGYLGYLSEALLRLGGVRLGPSALPLHTPPLPAPPQHLHHYSVATKANPWAKRSAAGMSAALGTVQHLVGLGDTRAPSRASGFGWAYALKLLHVQEAVARLPLEDLVLVTDAFDAYPVAPLARMEAAFAAAAAREAARSTSSSSSSSSSGSDGRPVEVLVSAEAQCFPDASLAVRFPASDRASPLPYPNSGVYMGRAGALHRLLREGPAWSLAATDDQDWFARAYLASLANASLPRVALDHDSVLAFSMGPLKSLRVDLAWDAREGAWQDLASGSHPSVFHYNGDKDDLQRALVPGFFYGDVCLAEHWRSCTWWAVVPPSLALLAATAVLAAVWLRLPWALSGGAWLQQALGQVQPPGVLRRLAAAAARAAAPLAPLAPVLLLSPALTVLVLMALCPLCARPQSTPWETLAYTVWPPSQLVLGHTEEAGGRALAAAAAVALDGLLARWLSGRVSSNIISSRSIFCFTRVLMQSLAAATASSALGGLLLQRAGGPGIELSGCILVSLAIVALARVVERLGEPASTEI